MVLLISSVTYLYNLCTHTATHATHTCNRTVPSLIHVTTHCCRCLGRWARPPAGGPAPPGRNQGGAPTGQGNGNHGSCSGRRRGRIKQQQEAPHGQHQHPPAQYQPWAYWAPPPPTPGPMYRPPAAGYMAVQQQQQAPHGYQAAPPASAHHPATATGARLPRRLAAATAAAAVDAHAWRQFRHVLDRQQLQHHDAPFRHGRMVC